jgi:hypothetical protein
MRMIAAADGPDADFYGSPAEKIGERRDFRQGPRPVPHDREADLSILSRRIKRLTLTSGSWHVS